MATFSFTVQVAGVDTDRDYEAAFYAGKCDDALLSVVDGTVFLDFDREAESYDDAVRSAVRDVEEAGAKVVAVDRLDD